VGYGNRGMKYYFILLVTFHSIEEIYTCNNPNTLGNENLHMLCNWNDDDFIQYPDGERLLRPKRKKDNFIKAYYRKKYWINKMKYQE